MFLRPNLYISHYSEIDLKLLTSKNIKGLILDVDNTLVPYFEAHPTEECLEFIRECQDLGYKLAIISNNDESRVKEFCKDLDIPFFWFALKPFSHTYKKALKELKLESFEVAVIGDQLLTDVLGGKKMGFYTILQQPLVEKDLIYTKINRKIEKCLLKLMKLKKGVYYD